MLLKSGSKDLQRIKYKKEKNPLEYAIKIILNTFYGICGNPSFASIYDLDTAADCTYIVREEHHYMERGFREAGYEIIAGDTDSFYILDPFSNKQKLLDLTNKLIEEIKTYLAFPQPTFGMALEAEILYIAFFNKKNTEEKAKKKYLYITKNGKIVIKGLEVVKSNCTKISKEIAEELKPEMIVNRSCKFQKEVIDKMIMEKAKDVSKMAVLYKCRSAADYPSKTSIYRQIAEAYGPGRHWLVQTRNLGVGKGTKLLPLEEAKNLKISDLDFEHVYSELEPFILQKEKISLSRFF